jgi:hypothetical protein
MVDARVKRATHLITDDLDLSSQYVRIPFVRELLNTVNDTESYYSKEFEERAVKIFDECDSDGSGVITGAELEYAVHKLLPEIKTQKEQSKPAHDGAEFSEEDRSLLEMQKAFVAMLHLDMVGFFGVPRHFMPAYSRFCFAWRLYAYFNTPLIQVAKNEFKQAKIDLIFLGGAFVHRREAILARLFIAYNEVFDFPVSYTDRPKEEGEINGLHHWFVSAEEFQSKALDPSGGFVLTYEEDGYRYGYLYFNLVRPNRERGKVALLPAVRTSEVRAALQRRENKQPDPKKKDFNLVTICFGAPLEHAVPTWLRS